MVHSGAESFAAAFRKYLLVYCNTLLVQLKKNKPDCLYQIGGGLVQLQCFETQRYFVRVTLDKEDIFLACLRYKKCTKLLVKACPLPPNNYSLHYKCSAQVISFEL